MTRKNSIWKYWEYWKNNPFMLIMYISIAIAIVLLIAFICKFYNTNFSDDSTDWGNFGAYLGSITGLLAFSGVLINIHLTQKQSNICLLCVVVL